MSADAAHREAWASLALRALPHAAMVALLRAFGNPEAILAASRAQLAAIIPDTAVARLVSQSLRTMCSHGRRPGSHRPATIS